MIAWRRAAMLAAYSGAAVVSLAACNDDAPPPDAAAVAGQLPRGVVAQVGSLPIQGETVARIAAEQNVDLRTAREQAIYDALLAAGARSGPEAQSGSTRAAVRGILAGAVLRQLWRTAQQSPISDEELASWTEQRWMDVDRPEGFRTVHAVALAGEDADEETHKRAKELAERWHAALGPATETALREPAPERTGPDRFRTDPRRWADPGAKAFEDALRNVDVEGLGVQVGVMPAIAQDGRVIDHDWPPGSTFVPEFAEAAAGLRERGDVSPVVRSSFGYHVIMLLERLPARRMTEAERREELKAPVWRARVEQRRRQLVERLRSEAGAEVATNADALLELASVEP